MKPTVISADVLFEDHRATLRWHWIAGLEASERRFDDAAISQARSSADLVGYLKQQNNAGQKPKAGARACRRTG